MRDFTVINKIEYDDIKKLETRIKKIIENPDNEMNGFFTAFKYYDKDGNEKFSITSSFTNEEIIATFLSLIQDDIEAMTMLANKMLEIGLKQMKDDEMVSMFDVNFSKN